jgi:hypothetical protein
MKKGENMPILLFYIEIERACALLLPLFLPPKPDLNYFSPNNTPFITFTA